MTSKKGRQLKLDLFPAKSWQESTGRPTKISISEERPKYLMGSEPEGGVSGVYDSRYKEMWVDPDPSNEETPGGSPRTTSATLSHEVAHFKLKHDPSGLYPGQPKESVEEFFDPLSDFVRGLEEEGHRGLETNRWEKVRAFVQELEVRIFQELKDYKQDPGDTFSDAFEEVYALQVKVFSANKNPLEKLIPIEAAKQAVSNMVKKGYIDRKEAFRYLSKINKIVLQYK